MRLRRWNGEPARFRLLAIFAGKEEDLELFTRRWLEWRGRLELRAAQIDPARLAWANGDAQRAYAVAPGHLPTFGFITWWLNSPDWRLFYRAVETEDDGDQPVIVSTSRPHGCYYPWGYDPEGSNGATPADDPDAVVLFYSPDGYSPGGGAEASSLTLPGTEFETLFLLDDRQPVLIGPDGHLTPSEINQSPPGRKHLLPLRLTEKLPHSSPANVTDTVSSLQKQINRLEEQLQTLRWWRDEPEVVPYLHIYPETEQREAFSVWGLRDWFIRSPDRAIRQFKHMRVTVESLGALHLVIPASLDREPTVSLPPTLPWLRLSRDWRWQLKGKSLFTTDGWELWPPPPPPEGSEHLEKLLTEFLWPGANPDDMLILIHDQKDQEYRFTVSREKFKSLDQQIGELNFQFAIKHVQTGEANAGPSQFAELFDRISIEAQTQLQSQAERMRQALNSVWSGERADLNLYRKQMDQALRQVELLRDWQRRIDTFTRGSWASWTEFSAQVRAMDRQLLEATGHDSHRDLQVLDHLRNRLSNLWELLSLEEEKNQRFQLAQSLRQLANQIEAGNGYRSGGQRGSNL